MYILVGSEEDSFHKCFVRDCLPALPFCTNKNTTTDPPYMLRPGSLLAQPCRQGKGLAAYNFLAEKQLFVAFNEGATFCRALEMSTIPSPPMCMHAQTHTHTLAWPSPLIQCKTMINGEAAWLFATNNCQSTKIMVVRIWKRARCTWL